MAGDPNMYMGRGDAAVKGDDRQRIADLSDPAQRAAIEATRQAAVQANAKQNLQKQQNIVDDQRLGFGGAKKVGSVAEGAVGIDQSYISDLENEQIALLKRKVEISEKLSQ